jgi:hypothetical protein
MACRIVLQALVGDVQVLASFALTPFTYQVVLARAVGANRRNRAIGSRFV